MRSKITQITLMVLAAVLILTGCPNDPDAGTNPADNTTGGKITSLQAVIDDAESGDTIDLSQYPDITDYNAEINKQVTVSGNAADMKSAALTVSADGVSISGISSASVTASKDLGNGTLKISSSSLSSLTINGGGIGSIVISDVTVDKVTIDKQKSAGSTSDQYVRLCVDGAANIVSLDISSSALIDLSGDSSAAGSFDLSKVSIKFTGDNSNDINVAVRKTITVGDASADQVKAGFSMDGSDADGFYIIANKGAKIKQDFYQQVFNKIAGNEINAEIEPPVDSSGNKFDFEVSIDNNTAFIVNTADQSDDPESGSGSGTGTGSGDNSSDPTTTTTTIPTTTTTVPSTLSEVIAAAAEGTSIDLSKYQDLTIDSVNIAKSVTLDGAGRDFGRAAINVSASDVTLKNVTKASVTVTADAVGTLAINDCSLDTLQTVYGCRLDTLDISDTTANLIIGQALADESADLMTLIISGGTVLNSSIQLSRSIYIDAKTADGADPITYELAAKLSLGEGIYAGISSRIKDTSEIADSSISRADFKTPGDEEAQELMFSVCLKKDTAISWDFFNAMMQKLYTGYAPGYKTMKMEYTEAVNGETEIKLFEPDVTAVKWNTMSVQMTYGDLPTVVFDKDSNGGYSIYELQNGSDSICNGTTSSYCFDRYGYMYVLVSGSKIWSDNPNHSSIELSGIQTLNSITMDRKTWTLYGKDAKQIHKIEKNTGSDTASEWTATSYDINCEKIDCFAVYDGTAYIASGMNLYKASLSSDSAVLESIGNIVSNTAGISSCSAYAAITDMTYMDGALYMLLRDYSFNQYNDIIQYSRGALIKYNGTTFSQTGWTDSTMDISDITLRCMVCQETNVDFCELSSSIAFNASDVSSDNGTKFAVYAPAAIGESFCGPVKFAGLKPNTLVIADDGVKFYEDSSSDLWVKNINRTVTLDADLWSFAVDSDALGVKFEQDIASDTYCPNGSNDYIYVGAVGLMAAKKKTPLIDPDFSNDNITYYGKPCIKIGDSQSDPVTD